MCCHIPPLATPDVNHHLTLASADVSHPNTATLSSPKTSRIRVVKADHFEKVKTEDLLRIMNYLDDASASSLAAVNRKCSELIYPVTSEDEGISLSRQSIIVKRDRVTLETLKKHLEKHLKMPFNSENFFKLLLNKDINYRLRVLDLTKAPHICLGAAKGTIPNLPKVSFVWQKTADNNFSHFSSLREVEVYNSNEVITHASKRTNVINLNEINDAFISLVNKRGISVDWSELNVKSSRIEIGNTFEIVPEGIALPCSNTLRKIGEIVHLRHLTFGMPERPEDMVGFQLDSKENSIYMPSPEYFSALERLTQLRSLTLKHVSFLGNKFDLALLVNLTALNLIECRHIDKIIPGLPHLRHLEELELNCGEGSAFMNDTSIYSLSVESVKMLGNIKPLKNFKLIIPRNHEQSFDQLVKSYREIKITELILHFQRLRSFTPAHARSLLNHPTIKKMTCIERGSFIYDTSYYCHLGGIKKLITQLKEERKKVAFEPSVIDKKPSGISGAFEKNTELRLDFSLNT